ncbi:hypothetical protein ES703_68022 [subsurface metagenome]
MSLSVLLPTWNNLDCLALALRGLEQYSMKETEILIHVDEAKDPTVKWLDDRGYVFSATPRREGQYVGWNRCAEQATNDYIILFSDDMFPAPNWDKNLLKWFEGHEERVIVPRLVEPHPGSYPPVYDCGQTPQKFNEGQFASYAYYLSTRELKPHNFGAYSMSRDRYNAIGGFDWLRYALGSGSIDLALRLAKTFPDTEFYEARDVLVYHFQRMAIKRIPEANELERMSTVAFKKRWGFNEEKGYKRLEERR